MIMYKEDKLTSSQQEKYPISNYEKHKQRHLSKSFFGVLQALFIVGREHVNHQLTFDWNYLVL